MQARSLQQQILLILEQARRRTSESPLRAAAEIRRRLAGRDLGDTVREIREDRDR